MVLYEILTVDKAGITPELIAWGRAFEAWLDLPDNTLYKKVRSRKINSWKHLFAFKAVTPGEVTTELLNDFVKDQIERGYDQSTYSNHLNLFSSFYRFCQENAPELLKTAYFNPALGLKWPKDYGHTYGCLSIEQARRLLEVISWDKAIIARRDQAVIATLLCTGLDFNRVAAITWGDICHQDDAIFLRSKDKNNKSIEIRISPLLWKLILDSLYCSGRLASMQANDTLFAPCREPLLGPATGKAEEWDGSGKLKNSLFAQRAIKEYAVWAGIDPRTVTVYSLKHTAGLIKMQQGASESELQDFLEFATRTGTQQFFLDPTHFRKKPEHDFPKGMHPKMKSPKQRTSRGAQPGNQNARTLGYFSNEPIEVTAEFAQRALENNGDNEIIRLTFVMERSLTLLQDCEDNNQILSLMKNYSDAALKLRTLREARNERNAGEDKLQAFIKNLLAETWKELDTLTAEEIADPFRFFPRPTQETGGHKPESGPGEGESDSENDEEEEDDDEDIDTTG